MLLNYLISKLDQINDVLEKISSSVGSYVIHTTGNIQVKSRLNYYMNFLSNELINQKIITKWGHKN
jgi:hypothetical protein